MALLMRMEARLSEPRMKHVHSDLLMAGECLRAEYLLSLHSGWSLNLVSSIMTNERLALRVLTNERRVLPGQKVPRPPEACHRHQGLSPAHLLDVRAGKPRQQNIKVFSIKEDISL